MWRAGGQSSAAARWSAARWWRPRPPCWRAAACARCARRSCASPPPRPAPDTPCPRPPRPRSDNENIITSHWQPYALCISSFHRISGYPTLRLQIRGKRPRLSPACLFVSDDVVEDKTGSSRTRSTCVLRLRVHRFTLQWVTTGQFWFLLRATSLYNSD